MRIYYNVTGERRKSLVGAISQELNTQVKYLGAPTFAYEVGGYTIDKNGELEGEDNSELVADLCGLHDFRAETEEYDTPLPAAVPVPADAPIPMEAALGGRVSPYRDEEEPPAYGHPGDDEPDHLIIEIPLEGFTDTALENLDRLISSKAALIKKAIGTDALPVERTETMLKFPWFRFGATSEEVDAYSRLVCALCAAAKEQKRVNAKEKTVENEKFAFRVFLIRLGFVGDEFKAARKILLKGLSGNSAFKDGTPAKSTEEATANIGESGKARVYGMEQNCLISDKLVSHILAIRDSGKVNMFDVRGVQAEANRQGFYDLVIFLEEHRKEYAEFILTGAR